MFCALFEKYYVIILKYRPKLSEKLKKDIEIFLVGSALLEFVFKTGNFFFFRIEQYTQERLGLLSRPSRSWVIVRTLLKI